MTRLTGDWLDNPASQAVCTMLADAGYQAFFVGGCVRDALLGRRIRDIDIATDALPQKVMDLADALGLKAIPTGIDHGTVTVISGGTPYEVTTFRRDVATDGRRAVVAFSDDMAEDARRRDFTMNALYADRRGVVHDPLGGLADLRARRVRFIDDPDARIREDYLRILRFFRFHARFADPKGGMDAEALAAISANAAGLETLSAERIGHEMIGLLMAPNPAPALAAMRHSGVLAKVLPGADDRFVAPLVHLEDASGTAPDALRRLAVMAGEEAARRLRLSRSHSRYFYELLAASGDGRSPAALGFFRGRDQARDVLLMRWAMAGAPLDPGALDMVDYAVRQTLPVSARDLPARYQGPAIGHRLATLADAFVASGFTLGRDDLLALPDQPRP